MSTPPILNLPTSACAASVIMSLTRVVGRTDSPFTLETQAFKWQGEQWAIDFQMPPFTNKRIAKEWISFFLKLEGSFGYILMGDPSAKIPDGVATGTPLVDGINQTGNTLITKGWTNGVTNIMRQGDYFQLGTGTNSRLYMITQDTNSDSSGNATLSFVPALRSSPANNAPLVVSSAVGVFRLSDNNFSWTVSPGGIYRMGFQAVEVINA